MDQRVPGLARDFVGVDNAPRVRMLTSSAPPATAGSPAIAAAGMDGGRRSPASSRR
jgi:hypothetical protein